MYTQKYVHKHSRSPTSHTGSFGLRTAAACIRGSFPRRRGPHAGVTASGGIGFSRTTADAGELPFEYQPAHAVIR
jgi:hypothetical protein